MHKTFSLVRPACDFAGVLSDDAAVGVIDGRMEAYNKYLSVSQPCDLPEFNVPVVDLDFALRKVTDPTVKVTDANVMLKGGGSTRVRRMGVRSALRKPDIQTIPIANRVDLMGAIDDVFAFTEGDPARAWSEGARFDGTTVTATNSIMVCRAELASACGFEGVTVSRQALAYMRLRRADLKAWGVGPNGILLEFEDGAWALASRMAMEMPDAAVTLVDSIDDWEDLQDVTPEMQGAIMRAGDWADDMVSIYPDRIFAGRFSSEHDEPAEIIVGEKVPALFAAKSAVTVISVADQIAFDRYPNPVPFTTKRGSKGLLAGRQQ